MGQNMRHGNGIISFDFIHDIFNIHFKYKYKLFSQHNYLQWTFLVILKIKK